MSDVSQGPGWWQASDLRWYPPEQHPEVVAILQVDAPRRVLKRLTHVILRQRPRRQATSATSSANPTPMPIKHENNEKPPDSEYPAATEACDTSGGSGWWLATDGKWYPLERHPIFANPAATPRPTPEADYRTVAPGWYRDPGNPNLARYWDGTILSEERRPGATPPHHPIGSPPPSSPPPSRPCTTPSVIEALNDFSTLLESRLAHGVLTTEDSVRSSSLRHCAVTAWNPSRLYSNIPIPRFTTLASTA